MLAIALEKVNSVAKDLVADEKTEKFMSGVTPSIVGGAVSAVAGPVAGTVASGVVSGVSRSHGKAVAEVGANIVVGLGCYALAAVATPFLVVSLLFNAATGGIEDSKENK